MSESNEIKTLRERLDFIGIDAESRGLLAELRTTIAGSIGSALDHFYKKASTNAHTRRFFADERHIESAKQRQMRHWDNIAKGTFDETYVQGVSEVGKVHARLGLEPRWYIGGYALILEQLIGQIVERLDLPGKCIESTIGALILAAVTTYAVFLKKCRSEFVSFGNRADRNHNQGCTLDDGFHGLSLSNFHWRERSRTSAKPIPLRAKPIQNGQPQI